MVKIKMVMIENKVIAESNTDRVIESNGKFYITHKIRSICVLPYDISNGIIDRIGVISIDKRVSTTLMYNMLTGPVTTDDDTDLVSANRILFNSTGINEPNANRWMYLGMIKLGMLDTEGTSLYAVNISGKPEGTGLISNDGIGRYALVKANDIISTDDAVLLASYLRLFQFFYINSINK